MSERLKPCPFCGSTKVGSNAFLRDGRQIGCKGCGASTIAFPPNANDKCVAAWNARAESVNQKLLDALKGLRIRFVGLFDSYVRKTYIGSDGQSDLNLALYDTDKAISEAEREKLK